MGKIYANQTKIDLYVECKFDVAGLTMANVVSHKLKLISPTNKVSTIESTLHTDGKSLVHRLVSPILNEVGMWTIFPYLIFDDNRSAYGTPSTFSVDQIGT